MFLYDAYVIISSKSKVKKLTGKESEIKKLLDKKVSKSAIARILGVHRLTVAEFVKGEKLFEPRF